LKIYLSGKMTGEKDYGKKLFAIAAKDLRDAGHQVYSPAEVDVQLGIDPALAVYGAENGIRRQCLRRDCDYICGQADAIVMLPNWRGSRGAIAEYHLAVAIGLEVIFWQPPATKKKKASSTKQQSHHAAVA
jgi:hypothetical protein